MTDRRHDNDRREEPRQRAGGRIAWRTPSGQASHSGWLSDRSDSSVSFIAAAWTEPSVGEQIELIPADTQPVRYHVTRTAFYGDNLSLVAGHLTA